MSSPPSHGSTTSAETGKASGGLPSVLADNHSADQTHRWSGKQCLRTTDGKADSHQQVVWEVAVFPHSSGGIKRRVYWDGKEWQPDKYWQPEEIIWPTWTPVDSGDLNEDLTSSSPLDRVRDYWGDAGNRIRESSKWMAAVLGAALAALIGTSPLAGMRERQSPGAAIILGIVGFALLALTMFLILQVLRPQSTSYEDVQRGSKKKRDPLQTWKEVVESQQDLYLPSGVKCLTTLRQAMIVEELTLMALSCAMHDSLTKPEDVESISQAQKARAARLKEWRIAASSVVTIGEFYCLRRRSVWASYLGGACGVVGTAAVVAAFAWPSAPVS